MEWVTPSWGIRNVNVNHGHFGGSRFASCVEFCDFAGKISVCTVDHKPANPPEMERIQNAGGSVLIQRVNGSLAVSRALGDFEYKVSVK